MVEIMISVQGWLRSKLLKNYRIISSTFLLTQVRKRSEKPIKSTFPEFCHNLS